MDQTVWGEGQVGDRVFLYYLKNLLSVTQYLALNL